MKLSVAETARVIGGRLVVPPSVAGARPRRSIWTVRPWTRRQPEVESNPAHLQATGVAVSSALVAQGDVFVALRGELRDGHDFVHEAFDRGAVAVIVGREAPEAPGPQIVVPDPLEAMRMLARWARDVLDPLVVGITGSVGKTSTKDMVAAIASRKLATVASERSYNNDVGVPLTLLKATEATEVVVCELGARGAGQIASLCTYVRPQIGIVTNVGVTHYEQFGSQEAIAAAKAELIRSLPEGGVAVLNADDPRVAAMRDVARAEVLTFGLAPGAWTRADDVVIDPLGRPSFRLVRGYESVRIELPVSGRHQVGNALAASAAALALGLSLEECAAGLSSVALQPWRMEVHEVPAAGGTAAATRQSQRAILVNDAYNASPASLASALETCAGMVQPAGRLIAILGYMAELGEIQALEHRRCGALAAALVDRLIVVGTIAQELAAGASEAGLAEVRVVADADAALDALGEVRGGDVVLVKASRVAGLEGIIKEAAERVAEKANSRSAAASDTAGSREGEA